AYQDLRSRRRRPRSRGIRGHARPHCRGLCGDDRTTGHQNPSGLRRDLYGPGEEVAPAVPICPFAGWGGASAKGFSTHRTKARVTTVTLMGTMKSWQRYVAVSVLGVPLGLGVRFLLQQLMPEDLARDAVALVRQEKEHPLSEPLHKILSDPHF